MRELLLYQQAVSCTANQSKQKKFFFKEKRHLNVYTLRNYNSARRTGSLLYFHDGINISGKQRGVGATCRKLWEVTHMRVDWNYKRRAGLRREATRETVLACLPYITRSTSE